MAVAAILPGVAATVPDAVGADANAAATVPGVVGTAADVVARPPFAQRGGGFFSLGQTVEERVFEVGAGGTLEVNLPKITFVNAESPISADVSIEAGAADVVEVGVYFVSGRMEWARGIIGTIGPRAEQSGNTVRVAPGADRIPFEQPSWAHSIELFIVARIPERFNVIVRNHHGRIRLDRLDGSVELEMGDGDIDVGVVRGPEVTISAGSGSISAEDLDAGGGRITVTSGSIEIGTLRGRLYAATSNGDVRVARAEGSSTTLRSLLGDISLGIHTLAATTLVSADGDISIRASASLSADVYFEGEDVRIDEAFALEGRRIPGAAEGSIEGMINGGGARLEAMAGDGVIRLSTSGSSPDSRRGPVEYE